MPENNMNFQPMPKRFMVWDKKERYFCYNHDGSHIFNIRDLAVFFVNKAIDGVPYDQFELVQSTNLFSRDGEEIFEGSILEDEPIDDGGVVKSARRIIVYGEKFAGFTVFPQQLRNGVAILDIHCRYKVVGHILSNPELLEEKNV